MACCERAHTPEQKRVVIERLYEAWLVNPRLRLGQLVCVLAATTSSFSSSDPFYVEDDVLLPTVKASHG